MAAFVDGNENDVDHQHGALVAIGLIQKEQIENQPDGERPARHGLPIFLQGFEEREAFGDGVRKHHGLLDLSSRGKEEKDHGEIRRCAQNDNTKELGIVNAENPGDANQAVFDADDDAGAYLKAIEILTSDS